MLSTVFCHFWPYFATPPAFIAQPGCAMNAGGYHFIAQPGFKNVPHCFTLFVNVLRH